LLKKRFLLVKLGLKELIIALRGTVRDLERRELRLGVAKLLYEGIKISVASGR
jgi:hypothetical protein